MSYCLPDRSLDPALSRRDVLWGGLGGLTLSIVGVPRSAKATIPGASITSSYVGLLRSRSGYDLHPKIQISGSRFELYWFGEYQSGEPDLPPRDDRLRAGDRIYFAASSAPFNGPATVWSDRPRIIYKGKGGSTGAEECDDHLVGSPAPLIINGRRVCFVEAYSNWLTRVVRFFSPERGDTWTTSGVTDDVGNVFDFEGSYTEETYKNLGFAPRYGKVGTRAIYAGEVRYHNGKYNRFLSLARIEARTDGSGVWRALHAGEPVFFLYTAPGIGRKPLYQFWDPFHHNTFVSDSPSGEGVSGALLTDRLGFSAVDLHTPDSTGCLVNRIRMLRRGSDMVWRPFEGAAHGGAVIAPEKEEVAAWPHTSSDPAERYDPARYYGSGFPIALVRGPWLELYFTDDTAGGLPRGNTGLWRIRVRVSQMFDADAYISAHRQLCGYYVSDIKWSPRYRRYFAYSISQGAPALVWTEPDPPISSVPVFPSENIVSVPLPTGLTAGWGGLSGDGLGRLDERFSGYIPVHVAFEQYPSANVSVGASDIGHALFFIWR